MQAKQMPHRPVKTPTILQMEHVECGAVALAIILAHHNKSVSLEDLRTACKVSRSGTKASHIVHAAGRYGLQAYGAQVLEIIDLKDIKPPFIAFWEFNHFVVVEGFKNNYVHINDPARGRYKADLDAFGDGYTGVILLFEPTPTFQQDTANPFLWGPYIKDLRSSLDTMTFVTLLSVFLILPGVIVPGFSKIFVDDILVKGYTSWFEPLAWGMMLTALVRLGITWLQQTYMMKLQIQLITLSANGFIKHFLSLPMRFFQQRFAGDILERTQANERIATFFSTEIISAFTSAVCVIFFGVILSLYAWQLFCVCLGALSLNVLLIKLLSRPVRDASHLLARDTAKRSATELNTLSMMETVKATGLESALFKAWAGVQADVLAAQQTLALQSRHFVNVPALLKLLCQTIVLCYGAFLVIEAQITVGVLVAFQTLYASFQEPFLGALGFFERFQKVQADLGRQQDVLKHTQDPLAVISLSSPPGKEAPQKIETQLQVTDITFSYDANEKPAITNLSLSLSPGKSLGLVGPSGSGKSTLMKLILGLYFPQEGTITWGGLTLEQIPASTLRASIGYTDLSISLFEGTVEDNLQTINAGATQEDMNQVLKDVGLFDTFAQRHGLQTPLLEGGTNLSVGQCQRLEIAKVLLHKPSILIFDEATSALDSLSEKQILDHLKTKEMTVIIVSHRLSAISACDEIALMANGALVARGPHDQLIKTNSLYQDLMAQEGHHGA